MTGLKREDLILETGAHVRVIGTGCKERSTPPAKSTLAVLKAWLREPQRGDGDVLFPSAKGERLSVHGAQYLLTPHRVTGADLAIIALWLGYESIDLIRSRRICCKAATTFARCRNCSATKTRRR